MLRACGPTGPARPVSGPLASGNVVRSSVGPPARPWRDTPSRGSPTYQSGSSLCAARNRPQPVSPPKASQRLLLLHAQREPLAERVIGNAGELAQGGVHVL